MQIAQQAMRSYRRMFLMRGIFAILFGVLVLVISPGITLLTLVYLFGAYAIIGGITAVGYSTAAYQKEWLGTAPGGRHPGHSSRHLRLCLAGYHCPYLALSSSGLGDRIWHYADRRCLYPAIECRARVDARISRARISYLRYPHRHLAYCRAIHHHLVDRYLCDCFWCPIHHTVLPDAPANWIA